jgi:hypothetical protein
MLDSYQAFVVERAYLMHTCNNCVMYQNLSLLLLWRSCYNQLFIMDSTMCCVLCLSWTSASFINGGALVCRGSSLGTHVYSNLIISYGSQQNMENIKLEFERY